MALVKINDTEATARWNKRMPFPKDRYTLRIVEAESGVSSNQNPMVTVTFEIFHPNPVQVADKKLDIDGMTVTKYFTTAVADGNGGWDKDKTANSQSQYNDFLKMIGHEEDWDNEKPPTPKKGVVLDAIVYGNKKQSYKEPTPEQRAQNKKVGDPIKDAAGNDVVEYQLNIDSFLGLSTTEVNRPY